MAGEGFASVQFTDKEIKKILKILNWKLGPKGQRDIAALMKVVVYRDVIEHFKDERGPRGRWARWSRAYEAHLNRTGKGQNKKLQYNGRLRQSFVPGRYENWRLLKDGVLFFNNAKTKGGFPYAEAHDEGGSVPGRPPARPFMWVSGNAMSDIANNILAWLKENE